MMTNFNGNRHLWGHDFRVVANGLHEADVAAFVVGAGLYIRAAWAKWWHHD